MNRQHFLTLMGAGCAGLVLGACSGVRAVTGILAGKTLELPTSAFESTSSGVTTYEQMVIVHHDELRYYVCVIRRSATDYTALLMRCSHQGASLQVAGDRLHCPAHGSEFGLDGAVLHGPATTAITQFPVSVDRSTIRIQLS